MEHGADSQYWIIGEHTTGVAGRFVCPIPILDSVVHPRAGYLCSGALLWPTLSCWMGVPSTPLPDLPREMHVISAGRVVVRVAVRWVMVAGGIWEGCRREIGWIFIFVE